MYRAVPVVVVGGSNVKPLLNRFGDEGDALALVVLHASILSEGY